MMDWTNISKNTLVEPYINEDGWYAQCHRCWTELEPEEKVCPKCGQHQDWSWLKIKKDKEE